MGWLQWRLCAIAPREILKIFAVYLVANPVIARALGNRREDTIGKLVLKKLLNRLDPELFDHFVNVVETGETLQQDFYYKSGESSWFHFVAVKLGDGFAITIRDKLFRI